MEYQNFLIVNNLHRMERVYDFYLKCMCDYMQNLFSVLKENASDINFLTMFTCSDSRDLRISLAVRRVPVVSRIA